MSELSRDEFVLKLEEELLLGGVILSEWSAFLIRDADEAFFSGADLATILVSQAAIECHLRYEYFSGGSNQKMGFYQLIEGSPLSDELKRDLHSLRKYRNQWVHVNDPTDDTDLLVRPEYYEQELENMAYTAIKSLHQVIYLEQWV